MCYFNGLDLKGGKRRKERERERPKFAAKPGEEKSKSGLENYSPDVVNKVESGETWR